MIPEDELSGLINGQLRVLAGQVIAALQDTPTSGVRKPRRPLPGGSSAAAALDEEG